MNNEWLDNEIECISKEKKKKFKNNDTKTMIQFIILLLPLLFIGMMLHAKNIDEINRLDSECARDDGIWWTCRRCRMSQWSNLRDWMGNYHCSNCGVRAGDE